MVKSKTMNLVLVKKNFSDQTFEFVERKGKGHPDTLSDNLAEYLSAKYSQYTKSKFGAILHHNFDKVGLLGGASEVQFGYGRLTKPIRVLLNGRASTRFADTEIDVRGLLTQWSKEFLANQLPINPESELTFFFNLSNQSSPGKTEEKANIQKSARKYWFEPRNLNDIPELKILRSNDTSMGVGFAPYSKLESIVLEIEKTLNSPEFQSKNRWIGSDIKIMGCRYGNKYNLTMCIPQIASQVKNIDDYKKNLAQAREVISKIFLENEIDDYGLDINTRDNYEKSELYLTAIGSSIESGDEGLVGRGNRIQGVITPMRPMSMEGAAGKNPVYHIGKLYYIVAQKISDTIYEKLGIQNEVVLVSQSGRELLDPWILLIHVPESYVNNGEIESLAESEVKKIPEITQDIVNLKVSIC
ncbi:MAG: methionine adenosyltransferase [Chloroflexi bacterium]|nr:methionine adenosyltransferase [Chloroflexota bacterium]